MIGISPISSRKSVPPPAAEKSDAESAAAQAVASLEKELAIPEPAPVAVASDPDVEIKRVKPASSSLADKSPMIDLEDDTPAPVVEDDAVSQPYIPPVAEEHSPAPRMPRVEDFPPIAQREIRAQQTGDSPSGQQSDDQQEEPAAASDADDYGEDERRPMGLLRRLASGLGRREDEEEPETEAPVARRVPQLQPAPMPAPRAPQTRSSSAGATGQLDETGRAATKPVSAAEDDQLEIPAFLRRQAN